MIKSCKVDPVKEGAMPVGVGVRLVFALGVLSIGMVFSAVTPSLAQSENKAVLVQDFNSFMDRCHPKYEPPVAAQSCTDDLAALTAREHQLNMSDTDLIAAGVRVGFRATTRGGFR
jgi:hypothetical protein